MRRKFRVVGLINENSEILGTTYSQVKDVITAGFNEEFERLESVRGVSASYAPVEQFSQRHSVTDLKLAMAQAPLEGHQRISEHLKPSLYQPEDWNPAYAHLTGIGSLEHAIAGMGDVASELVAQLGAQQVKVLQGTRLVADASVEVSFDADAGRVVMKDKQLPPADLPRGLGRRAKDKDHSF